MPTLIEDYSPRDFIEQIALLHSSSTDNEMAQNLETLLRTVVGRQQFSLIRVLKDTYQVVFSNHVEELRNRLTPPTIAKEQLENALREVPVGSVGNDTLVTIEIESVEVPIYRAWSLGTEDKQVGFVLFHCQEDRSLGSKDMTEEVQLNVSVAFSKLIEHTRLHEESDLLRAKLEAINEIGELLGSFDLEVLLTKLMELSLYIVGGQVGSIVLRGRENDEFESPIEWGLTLDMATSFKDSQGQAIFESVIDSGRAVTALDFEKSGEFRIDGPEVHVDSYVCIPLISKDKALGAVNLVNSSYTEMDREILMTICGLAATSIENAMLYADSLEQERFKESLKIARDIQQRLYPSKAPKLSWLDIAFRTDPCDETGGDYFDFFPKETDSGLSVVIGDVSGHGIGAALHMVAARSGLRATLASGVGLAESFSGLNNQLEKDMEVEHFMTMFICDLLQDGSLTFVNAGHDAPCVYRAGTGAIETLDSTGIPLGLFEGHDYGLGEVPGLAKGDIFLAMTDGVWEVNNDEGVMLGKEQMEEVFRQSAIQGRNADEIANDLLAYVAEYTSGRPARDDVTLLVLRAT